MPKLYRSRERAVTAVDTKSQLSTLGSETAPGPLLVPAGAKMLEAIMEDVKRITGQNPVQTVAKKSIAGFKIREGQVVGLVATLRGDRMYDFLEKLIRIALPRVRDFRGLNPKKFDGHGNYNIGIREQIVFPETTREHFDYSFGLEVNIQTSTSDDKQALELLKALGFPFSTPEGKKK